MGIGIIRVGMDVMRMSEKFEEIRNLPDICTHCHPNLLKDIGELIQLPSGFGVAFVSRTEFSFNFSVFIAGLAIPEVNPGSDYPVLDVSYYREMHHMGGGMVHNIIGIASLKLADKIFYEKTDFIENQHIILS
jgi:hypothetical protein